MIEHISQEAYFDFLDRHEERYRRVEALLKKNPTKKLWNKLLAQLEAWPDGPDFRDILLPHGAQETARWSAYFDVRYPPAWMSGALRGEDVPFVRLIKTHAFRDNILALSTCEHLTWLHEASFGSVPFRDGASFEILLERAPRLHTLRITYGDITPEALASLVEHPGVGRLLSLSLQNVRLTREHVEILCAGLGGLTSLQKLNLRAVGLDDRMCEILIASLPDAPSLSWLGVLGNGEVSAAMRTKLRATGLQFATEYHGDIIGFVSNSPWLMTYEDDGDTYDYDDSWE